MEVKRKMHELKSADVRFISLVTRAANRIPFRVVKQEQDMSIDLSGRYAKSIKKAEVVTPGVVGIVVFKQEDAALMEAIETILKAEGFAVESFEDNEDGTRVYKQEDIPADTSVIRLSEHTALVVKGFTQQAEIMAEAAQFSDAVPAEGFFQGPVVASQAYQTEMLGMVKKGDVAGIPTLTAQYQSYMGAMTSVLPAAAFKADQEIEHAVGSWVPVVPAEVPPAQPANPDEVPAEVPAAEVPAEVPAEAPVEEAAPVEVAKAEISSVQAAIADAMAMLVSKMDEFKAEMKEQVTSFRSELDNVARKQEDANTQVTTTVMAVAKGEKETPVAVQKQDDDPRTGCFDTAMHRRR